MAPKKTMETTIRTVVPGNKQQQEDESTTSFGSKAAEGADVVATAATTVSSGDENQADVRNGGKAGNAASEPNDGEKLPKEKDVAKNKDALTIEDLTLPKSIMNRLAKTDLPTGTQIQGNAMAAITRSTTVFISYLASAANDNAREAGKKTILPADVFKALEDTEFGFLRQQLEQEFAKYTELQTAKRSKKKPTGTKKDDSGGALPQDAVRGTEPRTKKAKIDEFAMDIDGDEADVPVEEADAEDVQDGEEEEGVPEDDEEEGEEEEEEEAAAGDDDEDDEEEAEEEADGNMVMEQDGFDDADLEEERMQRELLEQDDAVDDGDESD